MLKITSDREIETERFLAIMRLSNLIYFDKNEFAYSFNKEEARMDGIKKNLLDYMSFTSGELYDKITYKNAREYLVNYEDVPENEFMYYTPWGKPQGVSFDKTVRERVFNKGYAPYFFSMYNEYISHLSKLDTARTFVRGLRDTSYLTNNGNIVGSLPFYYNIAKTNRIYTAGQSIQGLPLEYCKHITSVKDYFLLWFDFRQIDFRVTWNMILRYLANGEISQHEDIPDYYLMFAKNLYESLGQTLDMETFKKDRPHYKTGTLATVYGGSIDTIDRDIHNKEFSRRLYQYINSPNNYGYSRYKKSLLDNINSELPFTAKTYFGTPINLHPGSKGVLNAGLNVPIQGTTADLIKIITLEIYDRMQKHINNPMRFYPYLNRHDECVFMCHKSTIPYLYEFLDCTRIQVDDWDPLELEWYAGYNYKCPDEELMSQIKSTMYEHPATVCKRTKPEVRPMPFKNVMDLNINRYRILDINFSLVTDEIKRKAVCRITKNNITVESFIEDYFSQLKNENSVNKYQRVIFNLPNPYYIEQDSVEFIFRDFNYQNKTSMSEEILCSIIVEYCKRKLNIEPPQEAVNKANHNLRRSFDISWKID